MNLLHLIIWQYSGFADVASSCHWRNDCMDFGVSVQ